MLTYHVNRPITADQFIAVLERSTLAERRPVDDRACMEGMIKNGNLLVTAWDGARLVGVARSVTDFSYACYLSDLAVDTAYQKQGIGKELIARTQAELGPHCLLHLISAPAVMAYYDHIGMSDQPRCWALPRDQSLKG